MRCQGDAPLKFVPAKWLPYIVDGAGRIDRRYYELCVLWELRAALRAGDVWLDTSRRYANPESYLISPSRWPAMRTEVCTLTQTPEDGAARLRERQAEFNRKSLRPCGSPMLRLLSVGFCPPAIATPE